MTNEAIAQTIYAEASSWAGGTTEERCATMFERYQRVHGNFSADDAFVIWAMIQKEVAPTGRPTDEEFHAMNDAAFTAWWDAYVERVQAEATSESEVQAAMDEVHAAWEQRWGNDRA